MATTIRSNATSAALYATVASNGSDTATARRPAALSGGDYSTRPFLTLAAAIEALPRLLLHPVHVSMGTGTFDGATVAGFIGGSYDGTRNVGLNIYCAWTSFSPTTGVATGTAGSGTTSTSMVKPTAAANWTASNLVGKHLKITGGGGAGDDVTRFPVVRPILANTTTTLTVDAISGMDNTTTFQIVSPATVFREIDAQSTCMRFCFNTAPVQMVGGSFAAVATPDKLTDSFSNSHVTLDGVSLNQNCDSYSAHSVNDSEFYFSNGIVTNLADVRVDRCAKYSRIWNTYGTGQGEVAVVRSMAADVSLVSVSSSSTVFRAERCLYVGAEISSTSGGGGATTPTVYLEGISNFEATGTNKLTGTGNAGYGLQIEGHGRYNLSGSTITGTGGDVLFFDNLQTWVNLGGLTYGIATEHSGSAYASSTYGKALSYGNKLHYGSNDYASRSLHYAHVNLSSNLAIVNLTNTTPYDMEANGVRAVLHVNSTNAGSIVVLNDACAIAGVLQYIANSGTHQTTAQAPAGGSITGSAVVTAGTVGTFVSLSTNDGKDFMRVS